jgi:alpha-amylase
MLSNGEEGHKVMEVGKRYANETFVDYLGRHPAEVIIDENGFGEFYVHGGSVSVWIEKPAGVL